MERALNAAISGGMSIRRAALEFGVSEIFSKRSGQWAFLEIQMGHLDIKLCQRKMK